MITRYLAFFQGLPFELYDKDPENWSRVLMKLYSIYLVVYFSAECPTPKKVELNRIMFDKFESDVDKIINYIQLHTFLHLGLNKIFVNPKRILYGNDYNSSQNIFITYPGQSGGNFLRNCLHFSDDISCVGIDFCESFLNKIDINKIVMDIMNDVKVDYSKVDEFKNFIKFTELNTVKEKLNYIILKTKSQVTWRDPSLDLNVDRAPQYNFHVSHLPIDEIISSELKIWPNCKTIIYFKNSNLFANIRKYPFWFWWSGGCYNYEKPINKETFLQFIERPQEHKQYAMDKLDDKIQINSFCNLDSKRTFYVWDTNWYFSEKDTITHIKELYEILSLSGFNEDAISKYYNVWIKTMSDLKTKALNEITK